VISRTEPSLDRTDPRGLVDALAGALKTRILAGELPAGSKLPSESGLAADYDVSRTVVREAVSRLRAAGLVDTMQGRGSYVLAVTEPDEANDRFPIRGWADLVHLMELRVAVESEAAGLAAERRTSAQLAVITRGLDGFSRVTGHPERLVEADFAFHAAIADASGNPFLAGLLDAIGPRAIMLHRTQLTAGTDATDADHLQLLMYEHGAIRDAIARGDGQAARAAMAVHLRRSQAALGKGPRG